MSQSITTRAVRAGRAPDPSTGALVTPIFQSTTFAQAGVGLHKGYTYSRSANPTVAALETALAAFEPATGAVAYSTGLAAIVGLLVANCAAGDRVVCSDVVYGGTARLLREVLAPLGIRADFVDTTSVASLRTALASPARLVLVETPANPTLVLTDVRAAAAAAHDAGALLAVDNTFLTAVGQPVLELGADFSVLSTTKYVDGHNATVGGAVLANDAGRLERLRWVRNALGSIQSPLDAWLTLQGLKTLPLRIARQSASALEIARWLASRDDVARVAHPFLDASPQLALAHAQQRLGGGLVAFELATGAESARRTLAALRLVTLAENLGSVESLATHPATMTHASIPVAERERVGIGDGLIRLSVGIEEPRDVIADLEQAIAAGKEPR